MAGSLLNYSTKVEAAKTASEILTILGKIGAHRATIAYGPDQVPMALEFAVDTDVGEMAFRLPARPESVYRILYKDWNEGRISGSFASRHHATRVAWRILKDWVEAQVALIQTGMVKVHEVMLPYALTQGGMTMFESFIEQRKALASGGGR